MIQITHMEPTPNANANKFVTDSVLVGEGALSYESNAEAETLELAKSIFALGGINNVYIQENFVSVNAAPGAEWSAIQETVQEGLQTYTPVDSSPAQGAQPTAAGGEGDLLGRVNAAVDKFVRPALASDGGGLEILGIEGHTVHVRYMGACGGCMSATAGTLMAIENLLRDQVDENLTLVAL